MIVKGRKLILSLPWLVQYQTFKAVNAINSEFHSRQRSPVAAPSRDCNPVFFHRSCNRQTSVQSSDCADSFSERETDDDSDSPDSDGYSWDYNGCNLNEGCNFDREWNDFDSSVILHDWHENISNVNQALDPECYQNFNNWDGEIENNVYEADVFEPEESRY